jgi:hypothetical protein
MAVRGLLAVAGLATGRRKAHCIQQRASQRCHADRAGFFCPRCRRANAQPQSLAVCPVCCGAVCAAIRRANHGSPGLAVHRLSGRLHGGRRLLGRTLVRWLQTPLRQQRLHQALAVLLVFSVLSMLA